MAFYNLDGDNLLIAPSFVKSSTLDLSVENKDEHTYPVEGWYWFDTDALAIEGIRKPTNTVTLRQAKLQLLKVGLLDNLDALMATNKAWHIEWEYATEVRRDNPLIAAAASQAGLTSEQVDTMFVEASKL